MIAALIRWSVRNRVLVVVAALIVTAVGIYAVRATPVDALPDLSDRLGRTVRTNSEALISITNSRRDEDLSKGVAIGSIVELDEKSHLEPCRHASGSDDRRSSRSSRSAGCRRACCRRR